MPFPSGAPVVLSSAPVLWGVDLGDVITVIVVLAIIVMSGLVQLLGKGKEAQQPGRRRPRPGRAMRAGQPRGAARPAAGGGVDDEIADFLRRAAQRRKPPPAQGPAPPRPAAAPRAAPQGRVMAEVVAEPVRRVPGAEQARVHLDISDMAQEADRLGADVARTDREFEQHLAAAFGPGLSALDQPLVQVAPTGDQAARGAGPPAGPSLPVTTAAGLAALLADTNNARLAIVLNEILTRPEERWR